MFQRIGEGTDVVRKEMYDFEDKGGRHLALRPEGTASVARAFVEHRPPTPWKVWYATPAFRYEQPQAGRLPPAPPGRRRVHRLATTPTSTSRSSPSVTRFLSRPRACAQWRLVAQLHGHAGRPGRLRRRCCRRSCASRAGDLAPSDAAKVEPHPLRVLDSKRRRRRGRSSPTRRGWPTTSTPRRSPTSSGCRPGCASLGIDVRGRRDASCAASTTTRTPLFEFQSDALGNAQNTILGGGRYDGLVEQLGGPPTPGIGFGCGIERVLLACDAEGVFAAPGRAVDVFVVDVTDGAAAVDAHPASCARPGVGADRAFDGRSMKAQMKAAGRSGARARGHRRRATRWPTAPSPCATSSRGEQTTVGRDDVVDHVRKVLEP